MAVLLWLILLDLTVCLANVSSIQNLNSYIFIFKLFYKSSTSYFNVKSFLRNLVMIKKCLYLLILCGQSYSMPAFSEPNSKERSLMFSSEQNEISLESTPSVDFFDFKKQQEELSKKQRHEKAVKIQEDSLNTSTMNTYEKTQYYLKKNDMNAVESLQHQQNIQYLQKAKDRGLISNDEYQRKFNNLNTPLLNQRNIQNQ